MTYRTQPGTLAHRVVEWLETQPPGAKFSTAEICEAIDADPSGFVPCVLTAVREGVLRRHRRPENMRVSDWSLGNGVPLEGEGSPDPVPAAPPPAPVEPMRQPKRLKVASVCRAPIPAPDPVPAPPPPEFRAALWTDGTLQLESGGVVMMLTAKEADVLRHWLQRVLGAV